MKNKILCFLLIILFLISGYIRYAQTTSYQFPFTYDQARDMLVIRIPGTFKDLPLIGPTTSINGVFLGPSYYYLNLPAFWLWRGDPQGLIYWNILLYLGAAIAIFLFFYKRNITLGFLIAAIYLFAPQLFNATRYFWNAHAMQYVVVFFFLTLWAYLEKKNPKTAIFLGITSGLTTHFEAALGIIAVAFSFFIVLSSKNKKTIGYFLLGCFPWFLPQIIFELKRGMFMTKLIISEFSQPSGILGNKIPITTTLISHWQNLQMYLEGQFILPLGLGKLILILSLFAGVVNKKYRKTDLVFASFYFFVWAFYVLTYHHELKKWYGEALRVWYVFIMGTGIISGGELVRKHLKFKIIYFMLISIFLVRSLILTISDQRQFINNPNFAKDDPKLMDHLIKSVDWVYQHAGDNGFKAYNYLPEIYDFPYQYVYWWYGRKHYGFMPTEVSYSPQVPDYVPRQSQFYENQKGDSNTIGLIYEKKGDYQLWLNTFDKQYCLKKKIDFTWGVNAEIREKCPNYSSK